MLTIIANIIAARAKRAEARRECARRIHAQAIEDRIAVQPMDEQKRIRFINAEVSRAGR